MIHPRLMAAVAASALAFAVAACGDRDAARKTDAPRPAAAATTASVAAAPVLQIASETKQFRDWSATCGNDGTCWAFGFASGGDGGWLRITLAPGPDARPHILFGYWPDGDAKGPPRIGLTIDGRDFAAALNAASEADAPIGEIVSDARPIIDLLAQGKVATIRGASAQDISLNGAAAALLWIDEKQGRLDTPTALMRRGDKPASTVPAAPQLPVVAAGPAVDQTGFGDENQTVPAALRSRTEVGNCLKESVVPDVSDMVMSARLDARTELWAVPCGSGAYNVTHYWYLTGPGGRDPRPAALIGTAGPGADPTSPDNATVNGGYDPGSRTLSAFAKGRGIGDCGAAQTWTWTGQRFVLTRESTMGECAGVPADLWPVAWRTR
ncbi:hypothetical protein SH203_02818 [Brevundimonas sp. SH203]|uniref:DUF1176 domain-containing protein n=1 Tax=Brevundimonas sp. SH203 TaxID=345167 RepID=UPI0009CE3165|nr:DUF1176 domain-containing protein [Brevundimonas sp. SH203]GAW42402.1 hypothetical protein SH203_02818 [Brevundimonas sp. SH203]